MITDMAMPQMTVDQLAAEIKQISADKPVSLCTGYSKKTSDAAAAELGIRALLANPVSKADLTETIRRVLNKKNESGKK